MKNEKLNNKHWINFKRDNLLILKGGPVTDEVIQWLLDKLLTKRLQILLAIYDVSNIVAKSTVSSILRPRSRSVLSVPGGEAVHLPFDRSDAFYFVRVLLPHVLERVKDCAALRCQALIDERLVIGSILGLFSAGRNQLPLDITPDQLHIDIHCFWTAILLTLARNSVGNTNVDVFT